LAKKKKLDLVKRKVAANMLGFTNVWLVHCWQEFDRIVRLEGAGLTDKEILYMRKQIATLQETTENIHRVWHRCHHGTEATKIERRR
jgi:5-bromo-4-chloroindolyl phosphate hydrolysis protein